jgi:type I restriction enzyme S subunit
MARVPLGQILIERRESVGTADGGGLPLIGVDNKIGLHHSRYKRLSDVSRYKLLKMYWFAYNPMRINVGSIGYANSFEKTGIISPDYVVFSCTDNIDPDYLFHFIKSKIGLIEIAKHTGGSVRERLYFYNLSKIEIELPALKDQKRISASLNRRKELINIFYREHNFLKEDFKTLQDCILQKAIQGKLISQCSEDKPANELLKDIKNEKEKLVVTGKLKKEKKLPRITEDEIPFELEKGWVWCRLGEVIKFTENFNIETKLSPTTVINYVDIDSIDNKNYLIKDVKRKRVSELSSRARRSLKKGYIVYSLVRPYLNNIAIIEDERENYIGSTGFAVFTGILVKNEYLKIILLSEYVRKVYLKLLSGFNSPGISQIQFVSTLIPLPPLAEQHRIISKVQQLMQIVNQLGQQVQQSQEQAQQLLQAVLKEAFTNKEEEYVQSEMITMAAEE